MCSARHAVLPCNPGAGVDGVAAVVVAVAVVVGGGAAAEDWIGRRNGTTPTKSEVDQYMDLACCCRIESVNNG